MQLLLDAGVEMDETRIDEVMKKLDTNGDGKISYQEFLTARGWASTASRAKRVLAGLEVVLPSKLNEVTGLQRFKLGLA